MSSSVPRTPLWYSTLTSRCVAGGLFTRRAFTTSRAFGGDGSRDCGQHQTFKAWKRQPNTLPHKQLGTKHKPMPFRDVIYLQPVGQIEPALLQSLLAYCQAYFRGLKVSMLEPLALEDPRMASIASGGPRKGSTSTQKGAAGRSSSSSDGYRKVGARKLFSLLQRVLPPDGFCVAAITTLELAEGIMGLAKLRQRVGVFSFAFNETFGSGRDRGYGDVGSPRHLRWSAQVLCHEIVHMFGVRHCSFFDCHMLEAGDLSDTGDILDHLDLMPPDLCPVDLRKMQEAIGFDVEQRYEALAAACQRVVAHFSQSSAGNNNRGSAAAGADETGQEVVAAESRASGSLRLKATPPLPSPRPTSSSSSRLRGIGEIDQGINLWKSDAAWFEALVAELRQVTPEAKAEVKEEAGAGPRSADGESTDEGEDEAKRPGKLFGGGQSRQALTAAAAATSPGPAGPADGAGGECESLPPPPPRRMRRVCSCDNCGHSSEEEEVVQVDEKVLLSLTPPAAAAAAAAAAARPPAAPATTAAPVRMVLSIRRAQQTQDTRQL